MEEKIAKPLLMQSSLHKILLFVLVISIILGIGTGYLLSNKTSAPSVSISGNGVKNPTLDTKTFRDFAEGILKSIPPPKNPDEYTEGTHILEREGAIAVTLTSSIIDLSKYEGKKIKVFGETQKALKAGWLMDVGKVEEIK